MKKRLKELDLISLGRDLTSKERKERGVILKRLLNVRYSTPKTNQIKLWKPKKKHLGNC